MTDESETRPTAGEWRQNPEPQATTPDPSANAVRVAAEEQARTMRLVRRVIVGLGVAVAILYFTGSLDKMLAPVGLNFRDCATNGFGATFCGDDLEEYQREVVDPIRNFDSSYP